MDTHLRLRQLARQASQEVAASRREPAGAQLSVVLPAVLIDWVVARSYAKDQLVRDVVEQAVARFGAASLQHRAVVIGEVGVWSEEGLPVRHVSWRVGARTRERLRAWQLEGLSRGDRWTLRELTLAALSDLYLAATDVPPERS